MTGFSGGTGYKPRYRQRGGQGITHTNKVTQTIQQTTHKSQPVAVKHIMRNVCANKGEAADVKKVVKVPTKALGRPTAQDKQQRQGLSHLQQRMSVFSCPPRLTSGLLPRFHSTQNQQKAVRESKCRRAIMADCVAQARLQRKLRLSSNERNISDRLILFT